MNMILLQMLVNNLVNKLLIAKIPPAKNINIFNALILVKAYADKK